MKRLTIAIASFTFIACSAFADEYGYFYSNTTNAPTPVTLHAGDRLVLLANRGRFPEDGVTLMCTFPDGNRVALGEENTGTSGDEEGRTVCGPCTVTLMTSSSGVYASYRIVRAATAAIQPNNVISLPPDVNGDMQVIVETSRDLLTWEQVYSFTHDSTDGSSRFFRTRVIQAP